MKIQINAADTSINLAVKLTIVHFVLIDSIKIKKYSKVLGNIKSNVLIWDNSKRSDNCYGALW